MDISEFLAACLPVTETSILSRVAAAAKVEPLKKGALLIESGLPMKHLSFLIHGVLRGFLIDMNGKDITDCFVFRSGDPAVPSHSLELPAQISIEAVIPSEVLKVPMPLVGELLQEYPELIVLYNQHLIQALERHWEIKMMMYQYTAMQRYQWFLSRYPELSHTVNSRHIASYLGITPVTLSRLRTKLKKEQVAPGPLLQEQP